MAKSRNSKEKMYKLIQEWESSGLSQEKFIQIKGIAKSTFGYWRRKYNKEKRSAAFIPVKVTETRARKSVQPRENIELSYPNGVVLRCSDQIELSRLKTLIVL
ncbi:MAG: IS66 family insertion sequence hypothetical protein [Marinilabiliales bacterium]|nr:MAG: IS66 family insertion sequence hypothetical protein [Marinilabiliales bacterium]